MKNLLNATALAAALCLCGAAQAGVITFNDPAQIEIDNATGATSYTEAGFVFSAPGLSFLTLNDALVGGVVDATPFSLRALGGGPFALLSLDFGAFDLGFGDPPGVLTIVGLGGALPLMQMLNLGAPASFSFGDGWSNLTEVTFSGTSGFFLDNVNVNAVPEPSTLALSALGALGALGMRRASRGRRVAG
ncbi:MAG: PEP-CTERM sorting domain-containing protein [Chitinophagaceae bacterium]|nr:PEP-CTERM sorting domain-containing protein [Rubrivivax sp.]